MKSIPNIKLILVKFIFIILSTSAIAAPSFNMAYVGGQGNLSDAACYIRSDNGQPYFNIVSIFAASIKGTTPSAPTIQFNNNVSSLLNSALTPGSQVYNLRAKGLKVLLTVMGGHAQAGWSCFTNQTDAESFAKQLVTIANQYGLDGIDIDDEYSNCTPNSTSLIMVAQAIKNDTNFSGKILTKALYADAKYFKTTYNGHTLAEYLDYGWEMNYTSSNFSGRLSTYLQYGMSASNLALGVYEAKTSTAAAKSTGAYVANNSLGGVMVYNVTNQLQDYLSAIAGQEYGNGITLNVAESCFLTN